MRTKFFFPLLCITVLLNSCALTRTIERTNQLDVEIKEKQVRKHTETTETTKLKNEQDSLVQQERTAQELLKNEQKQLVDLDKEIEKLKCDLNQKVAKSAKEKNMIATSKKQILELQDKLQTQHATVATIQSGIERDAPPLDQSQYNQLQHERDALAKEYQALLQYSQALSDATN
jgi:hypothetical protein